MPTTRERPSGTPLMSRQTPLVQRRGSSCPAAYGLASRALRGAGLPRSLRVPRRNRSLRSAQVSGGFTLIELLVVIAIITILGGLSMAALNTVRKNSQIRQTEMILQILKASIASYESDFHDFPDSGGKDGVTGSEKLLAALSTEEQEGPYIKKGELNFLSDANHNGQKEIADVWGRPIEYYHKKDYGRNGPNAQSYRLISGGYDGEMDPFDPNSDDIVNWNKKEESK